MTTADALSILSGNTTAPTSHCINGWDYDRSQYETSITTEVSSENSALPISRGHFSPNNSRKTPIARCEGEIWVFFVSSKFDRSFTFEFVVFSAMPCYIAPRYIESL